MAEHVVSYSSLTTHRACPQRWQYAWVQRIEKMPGLDAKVELEFGSWWHAVRAADSIDRGRKKGSLVWCPDELRTTDDGPRIPTEGTDPVARVLDTLAEWWHAQPIQKQDDWIAKLGEDAVSRIIYMDEEWRKRWADDIAQEQPLGVEVFWRRELPPLPQPDGDVDPDTAILGYIDEVYYDERRGIVVARDHKTGKSLAQQSSVDDMMDSQLQIYAWGAAPLVQSWGRGPIRAVAYDRVRTVKPKEPVLTLMGGLSKQVTDFDLRTYLEWVGEGREYPGRKADGSGAGVYQVDQKEVARLSDPAYLSAWHQRTLTPLNRNVVRAHLRAAVDSSLDVITTRQRLAITGEAARNLGQSCRWCDFAPLCRAQMLGGPEGEYDLDSMGLRQKPPRE